MKTINRLALVLFMFAMLGCANMTPLQPNNGQRKIQAKVTLYTPHEDKWGARVAYQKVKRAMQGVTVAMERSFPFGTRVIIPGIKQVIGDDSFIVQDRGTDIERRRASRGRYPVIDVFVNKTNKAMRRLAYALPQGPIDAFVLPPAK